VKKKGQTLVPRNPFALAARQRRAGAHDKTRKIKRRDDRQALRKLLHSEKEEDGNAVLFLTEKPFPSRGDNPRRLRRHPLWKGGWGWGCYVPMDAGGGIFSFQFCGDTSVSRASVLRQ
jgi:hypothetical protein